MCIPTDRGHRSQAPRCPPPTDRSGTRSGPAGCEPDGKHWQTHFGWSFCRTHRRCAACAGNGVQGPFSHLPSRRKAGRGFPFHPLLVFQMPLLAIFSEISQKYFFRGSCCAPFVLFGWMFLPERRAAGSGSPQRKSAGNDKKRPHRHKSLNGRFGAVQYGNCRRLPEGIGILRCPGIVRLCSRRGLLPQH